jgi:hypothetical protein
MVEGGGPGLSNIPIISDAIDLLTEIFSQAAQIADLTRATEQVEAQAWSNTLNLAGFAYGLFGGVLDTIGNLLKSLGALLEHLLVTVIFGHLLAIIKAVLAFLHHLRDLIAPLIKYLQQLQASYNKLVGAQMRKYIDLIQRLRKILVPFRLLHLGFATKLDTYLAKYESDIGAKWAKLIAFNTQILGVLNDVLDPRQLMRPGHALGSIGMMIGAVHGAVGALDVRQLFCLAPIGTPAPLVEPWSTTQARVLGNIAGTSGDYATYLVQRDTALRQYAIDLGVQSVI